MALSKLTSVAKSVARRLLQVVVSSKDSVQDLVGYTGLINGQQVSLKGWHPDSDVGGGTLYWAATKPKSEHNGGTVFSPTVPYSATTGDYLDGVGETNPVGSGCWVRKNINSYQIEMFGAIADWNGATGTSNASSLLKILSVGSISKITSCGGSFYFGEIVGGGGTFTVSKNTDIDWNNAELICAGDVNQVSGNYFIEFFDCRGSMINYTFNDINFEYANTSRGVGPVLIHNSLENTDGYTFGPFRVIAGQSLVTAVTDNPLNARANNITFSGSCYGEKVYYGANLANSGDNFTGDYSLNTVNRSIFVYGVDGVRSSINVNEGQASSANVLVSSTGTGSKPTKNIDINARFNTLDGRITMADQPSANGTGEYENVKVKVYVDTLGTNLLETTPLITVGAYNDVGSYYTTEKNISANNITFDLTHSDNIVPTQPMVVYTPSPNYGLFTISNEAGVPFVSLLRPKNEAGEYKAPTFRNGSAYITGVYGDMTDPENVAIMPARYIGINRKNSNSACILHIQAVDGAGGRYTNAQYLVIGAINSSGSFTLTRATLIAKDSTGGVTPIITISAADGGLGVSIDSYVTSAALIISTRKF